MTDNEDKRKHLQLIQDVITRMGSNSFLLKGWSISLVTALIGFGVTHEGKDRASLLIIATALCFIFWLLDGYYLSQERQYRKLYNNTAKTNSTEIDYSLNAKDFNNGDNTWFASMFSVPFLVFYVPAILILGLVCDQLIGINIYLK